MKTLKKIAAVTVAAVILTALLPLYLTAVMRPGSPAATWYERSVKQVVAYAVS